jgi:predicted alpha-1,2-mannosidase
MVQLSPDTRVEGWDACAGYHYSDSTILGFSHTHLSGTGIPDYGDILLTPISGPPPDMLRPYYPSRFSHDAEEAHAGYYRVFLDDHRVSAELTATTRVGVHRYSFSGDVGPTVLVNLLHGLGPDRVTDSHLEVVGPKELAGSRRSSGWAKDQQLFFHIAFSEPFSEVVLLSDDHLRTGTASVRGANVKCAVRFPPKSPNVLMVKVGLSFVSLEGAGGNIEAETPGWDFEGIREGTEIAWEKELGKIRVDGGTEEQRTTFYTALYHAMLAPNAASDTDYQYRSMSGGIAKADGFVPYSVFSLWDTFRAEHPLLSIIDPARTTDFVRSLLAKYEQSGVLPVWELASNETWTMIGYHAVPVIFDAYAKGIRGFDADLAFRAMQTSATLDHFGLKSYRELGYVPADHEGESVSKTLEYAYDDWCIGQMALLLGRHEEAEIYLRRSQSYKNLYDPSTGFMRPKANSSWVEPFDPSSVTFHYTEANAWQYGFLAVQDVQGLIQLMGGREAFAAKLDSLFKASPELRGRHQADITGLIGQYAHGNEPSHHAAWLFNYAGYPAKTQHYVRKILDSLYTARPDGLPGNEDCGQMSAWYVLSAIGLYQVCPGDPVYTIGSPLFPRAVVQLENGKEFVIEAEDLSPSGGFVQSAQLNGQRLEAPFFSHNELAAGGKLQLAMGMNEGAFGHGRGNPFVQATTKTRFVPLPAVHTSGTHFSDSLSLTLSSPEPDARIQYTLDGSIPGSSSKVYNRPIVLHETSTLRARAIASDGTMSDVAVAHFSRHEPVGSLTLFSEYSPQYTGGGDNALIDGRRGGSDWRLGAWQGYQGADLVAVVDLGDVRGIKGASLGCLQDENSWIFLPVHVEFSLSEDGIHYDPPVRVLNPVSPGEPGSILREFHAAFNKAARYIRVEAKSLGICPEWHKGKGNKAWLFVDEMVVEM